LLVLPQKHGQTLGTTGRHLCKPHSRARTVRPNALRMTRIGREGGFERMIPAARTGAFLGGGCENRRPSVGQLGLAGQREIGLNRGGGVVIADG
jgi:hypothetical protein